MLKKNLLLIIFLFTLASPVFIQAQEGECFTPEVSVDAFGYYDISLSWQNVPAATFYQIRYRPQDTQDWTIVQEYPFTYIGLGNLQSGIVYEIQVQPICGETTGEWSPVYLVSTLNCENNDVVADAGNDIYVCGADMINLKASGGETYLWLPATAFNDAHSANPEVYVSEDATFILIAADANGCTDTDTVQVFVLDTPTLYVSGDSIVCSGDTAMLEVAGSDNYLWQQGDILLGTDSVLTVIPQQTTTYKVSSILGDCTATASFTVYVHQLEIEVVNALNTTICGGNDGAITIVASADTTLEYSIDGGVSYQNDNFFQGLTAGSYTVMIRTADNCYLNYENNPVTVGSELSNIAIDTVVVQQPTCESTEGSFIAIVAQGNYLEYSIDGVSFQTTPFFENLTAGNYTIQVRDTVSGCLGTYNETIHIAGGSAMILEEVLSTDDSCAEGTDGSITLQVSGGNGALAYSIDGGATFQSSPVFENLGAGIYIIEVRDTLNCVLPDAPMVVVQVGSPLEAAVNIVPPSACQEGTAAFSIDAEGGTPPYQYSLNGGIAFTNQNTFINMSSGTYNVLVEDVLGCQTNLSFTLPSITGSTISLNYNVTAPTSCQSPNGSLVLIASGGTAPYEYSIDGGVTFFNTPLFNNLSGGTYSIVVQDAAACSESTTAIVPPLSTNDLALTFSLQQPSSCAIINGGISIAASGGTPPYQYSIDGGATFHAVDTFSGLAAGTYAIAVRDANGCVVTASQSAVLSAVQLPQIAGVSATSPLCADSNNGQIVVSAFGGNGALSYSVDGGNIWTLSNTFNNLTAGVYTVQVRDEQGCVVSYATPLTLTNPPALVAGVQFTNVSVCGQSNGQIGVFASGGTPPLQYSINNGQVYANSNIFSNLPVGIYFVKVRDAQGCVWNNPTPIFISDPSNITINSVNTTPLSTCNSSDASLSVFITGGTDVVYSIDGGSTWHSNAVFYNLPSGVYNILVQDVPTGCTAIYAANPVVIEGNSINILEVAATPPSCNGGADGTISINATYNGTLEYSIDGGITWSQYGFFGNVAGGNYLIKVRTTDGTCEVSYGMVNIINPAPISISAVNKSNITECGKNDGSINIVASGGSGVLQYSINGGNGNSYFNQNTFNNLAAGVYAITVRDAKGCIQTYPNSIVIQEPSFAIAVLQNTFNICLGESVVLQAAGAAQYVWSPSEGLSSASGATVSATPTQSTVYTVSGTNVYGCSDTETVTITVNTEQALANIATAAAQLCEGDNLAFSNAAAADSYLWAFEGGLPATSTLANPFVTYNTAGTFSVTLTVTSCGGQSDTQTLENWVLVNETPSVEIVGDNELCAGESLELTAQGAAESYSWTLTDGSTAAGSNLEIIPSVSGWVQLAATNGTCSDSTATEVKVYPLPTLTLNADTSICLGDSLVLTANSNAQYFAWSPTASLSSSNSATTIATPAESNICKVIATSLQGCRSEDEVLVLVRNDGDCTPTPPLPSKVPNAITPNGDGKNDTWVLPDFGAVAQVQIFDRWGRLVYESQNYDNSWAGTYQDNGEQLQDATYYYIITVNDGRALQKGTITVLH
ncbi:MAG: gliding motility-associated C-terminal domain-containing protein [Sphingobacteriales bacterium]|nr:gliding motility-associated C-terminal domain-containing protein [Sphingobacteriales bacterium]